MKKRLLGLLLMPIIIGGISIVNASVTTVPGLVVTGEQDGKIFEYGVLKFDDGSGNVIMLLDRNLGATTNEITSTGSYGYYYQRGNNYGFDSNYTPTTGTQVSILSEAYSPFYTNPVFIVGSENWYNDNNRVDLWGGSTTGTDAVASSRLLSGDNWKVDKNTVTNRRGPCPENFHVPSLGELVKLSSMFTNVFDMKNQLRIPIAGGRRYSNASFYDIGYGSYLWSSSPSKDSTSYFLLMPNYILLGKNNRAYAYPVRCFYDKYEVYPRALNLFFISDGEEVGTGEVTENMTGAVPEKAKNVTKTGYVLEYRYLSGANASTGFDFETTPISGAWADESGNVYFIAQWTGIKYEIKFEAGDGTGTMENQTFIYDVTGTLTPNAFTKTGYTFSGWIYGTTGYTDKQNVSNLTTTDGETVTLTAQWTPIKYTISFSGNAADATGTAPATINAEYDSGDIAPDNTFTLTGYTFTGWNTESNGSGTGYATGAELKNLTTTNGDDVMLYAQWEVNIHKLSFVVDGNSIQSGDIAYAAAISAPAEPKKDCNSFAGWTSSVEGVTTTGTMPDSDVIFTANWNYTCSRSSGGGGGSSRSNKTSDTQDSSTSSQNDKNTENVIQSDPEHSEWESEESSKTPMDSSTSSQNDGKSYTQEFQEAYEFAHERGITTMPTIQDAQMDGKLTRIAMAKMLSQYAMNVLGQKPANIVTPKFNDVTDKQNSDYDDGVTLAYQLGIMGQNMPNNKFRPDDEVTRAEFATALSRMLYHTPDGEYKSTDKYYTNHMKKLVQEKIITNDDAKMKELRGYVMIMLMRSAK